MKKLITRLLRSLLSDFQGPPGPPGPIGPAGLTGKPCEPSRCEVHLELLRVRKEREEIQPLERQWDKPAPNAETPKTLSENAEVIGKER